MNGFEQAVIAHQDWKRAFERSLHDGGGDLRVDIIRLEDRCLLGRWLHGEGSKAVANPTAAGMLREIHAEFHAAAADALALAQAGRVRDAIHALAEDAPYGQWSATLLRALKNYAQAEGALALAEQLGAAERSP